MTTATEIVWEGAALLREYLVPIGELEPFPGNPRRGDVDTVRASLVRFGQVRAVLITGKRIVAGHHVVLAAKAQGWTHVAAMPAEFHDEEEARAYLLADNGTHERGGYDDDLLLAQLNAVRERGLEGTGYTDEYRNDLERRLAEIRDSRTAENLNADIDRAPPVPKKPTTKLGELVELGPHRLFCGDATNAEHVAALMGDERATLLFTSPPYLDLRTYGGELDLAPEHLAAFISTWAPYTDLVAVNLGLIVRDHAIVPHWDVYVDAARQAGLKLLAWNVWNREDATNMAAQQMMFPTWHEWVFVFGTKPVDPHRTMPTKNAGKTTRLGQRQADGTMAPSVELTIADRKPLGSVLTMPSHKGPTAGDHPAVFPVRLPFDYMRAVTDPDDLVLDPFAGSGTTLIAAESAGRRAFLMELNPGFCDVVRQRYADLTEARENLAWSAGQT